MAGEKGGGGSGGPVRWGVEGGRGGGVLVERGDRACGSV